MVGSRGGTCRSIRSGSSLAADITPAAVADLRLSPGDEVWLAVKAAEVAIHPLSGGSSGA
ncbi:TOBE domain-containing protein [Saccharopolyspora kobensis]|uniref:TOBE domain-containing protein n=1 Tax=Saccharopolyspora kobensis TaxID=146035 RepID=UPI003D9EDBF3